MTTDNVLIHVENLQKSFGSLNVLDGIDIDINRGDVVVVVGPSGSGKSTFLRCLNRLEECTGGSIYFNGVDITGQDRFITEKDVAFEELAVVAYFFLFFVLQS